MLKLTIASTTSTKDTDSLSSLWRQCFNSDSVFLKLFLEKCLPHSKTYVFKDGDSIISSITLIPIENQSIDKAKGAYLYGVCTLPSYRGNRLTQRLIEFAEEECKKEGYGFMITRPASASLFALYRKIGFTEPIYRQTFTSPLPPFSEGLAWTDLTPSQLKILRKNYLKENYFDWDNKMLDYIIEYTHYLNGIAVEFESKRYIIGYPDNDDPELFNLQELGCHCENLKYPTLYLAGTIIKARYLGMTKVKISLPINKYYSDIDSVEREVYVLGKPLLSEIPHQSFFNFTLE